MGKDQVRRFSDLQVELSSYSSQGILVQSLFGGRRVAMESGSPIVYRRYNSIAELQHQVRKACCLPCLLPAACLPWRLRPALQ